MNPSHKPNQSRSHILDALRSRRPPVAVLPELSGTWITYPDPVQHFAETLAFVGGRCEQVTSWQEARVSIERAIGEAGSDLARCCSVVEGLELGGVRLAALKRPHDLADLQWMLAPGRVAVAENGAVWVEGSDVTQRVALFIATHLVLVVPRSAVVSNMHEAYERIECDRSEFGVFISGPSKTADIEQSLVIGAHGPKTMTVYLVSDA